MYDIINSANKIQSFLSFREKKDVVEISATTKTTAPNNTILQSSSKVVDNNSNNHEASWYNKCKTIQWVDDVMPELCAPVPPIVMPNCRTSVEKQLQATEPITHELAIEVEDDTASISTASASLSSSSDNDNDSDNEGEDDDHIKSIIVVTTNNPSHSQPPPSQQTTLQLEREVQAEQTLQKCSCTKGLFYIIFDPLEELFMIPVSKHCGGGGGGGECGNYTDVMVDSSEDMKDGGNNRKIDDNKTNEEAVEEKKENSSKWWWWWNKKGSSSVIDNKDDTTEIIKIENKGDIVVVEKVDSKGQLNIESEDMAAAKEKMDEEIKDTGDDNSNGTETKADEKMNDKVVEEAAQVKSSWCCAFGSGSSNSSSSPPAPLKPAAAAVKEAVKEAKIVADKKEEVMTKGKDTKPLVPTLSKEEKASALQLRENPSQENTIVVLEGGPTNNKLPEEEYSNKKELAKCVINVHTALLINDEAKRSFEKLEEAKEEEPVVVPVPDSVEENIVVDANQNSNVDDVPDITVSEAEPNHGEQLSLERGISSQVASPEDDDDDDDDESDDDESDAAFDALLECD